MKKVIRIAATLVFLYNSGINAEKMRLTRAILASNENIDYLTFWPVAAKAWKQLIGITPTLALVADDSVVVDETLGDVIRFKPIKNGPSSYCGQVIRLLLPALYPDDVCIISDIDQIPVNRDYFHNAVKDIESDHFVIMRKFPEIQKIAHEKLGVAREMFPMSYVAGKGSTFAQVFNIATNSVEAINNKLELWAKEEYPKWGWYTDQQMLYVCATSWEHYNTRCDRQNLDWVANRIYYYNWNPNRIKNKQCFDIAFLKPYPATLHLWHEAARLLGLES